MKNDIPILSVIVPVYNNEQYLSRCVSSIVNQSFGDFELLLIDDGSTDGSGVFCDDWKKKDNRIKVIHQLNKGVSAARNNGIMQSRGEYIAFVDSDDWVEKDYLYCLLNDVRKTDGKRGLVIQGFVLYTPEGNRMEGGKCFTPIAVDFEHIGEIWEKYDLGEFGFSCSKLYDRSLLMQYDIRFDERISFCEDLLFRYDYILNIDYLVIGSAQEYAYVKYSSSLSALLHPFDMEYLCFMEYQKKVRILSKVFGIPMAMLPNVTTAMMKVFQRALKTDYQIYNKSAVNRKVRLRHLKKLIKTNEEIVRLFYHPVCKGDCVGKFFLVYHCYSLYDIYMCCLFKVGFVPLFRGP